ncbi:MAG: hypothetical protein CMH54_06610 [Myxococcales bacterium]|nr:hypothetical protein [Myxococcales bacterium]
MFRKFISQLLLLCLIVTGTTNCADDTLIFPPAPGISQSGDTTDAVVRYMIIPLHDVENPVEVEVANEVKISVRVIDLDTNSAAGSLYLSTNLQQIIPPTDAGPAGDASVSAAGILTDIDGKASVVVTAGNTPNIIYDLVFTTEMANDAIVPIQVMDRGKGDLRVGINYSGPIPLKTIRVGLIPGYTSCSHFHAQTAPDTGDLSHTLLSIDSKATFEDLYAEDKFTVIVTATTIVADEGEHLAAGGCLDGVFVPADGSNDVTVTLHLAPLMLTGTYRVEGTYNFTNLAVDFLNEQGLAGEILADILTFFNDPGEIIMKYVEEAAKQFLPDVAVEILFEIIGEPIGDALTDWLLDIPELQDFWTISQDLTGVVNGMELISLVQFSKVYSDYNLNGTEEFIGLNLYWKLGCDPAAPDYDECGKYTYTLEDFDDPEFPLDLASSHFTASILNWNQLQIDPHVLYINYGKLILFGLEHILLPEIADGATNLGDAMSNLLNCEDLGSILGIPQEDIQNACISATGMIGGFIQVSLNGLKWDSNLSLYGSCLLLDDHDDLIVDRLINGQYTGTVVMSGSTTSEFSAEFEGTRLNPDP